RRCHAAACPRRQRVPLFFSCTYGFPGTRGLLREFPLKASYSSKGYGRGAGVGRDRGVGVALGVGVGLVPLPAKLNFPMRVCQLKLPFTAWYSFICQKLVPSEGSIAFLL